MDLRYEDILNYFPDFEIERLCSAVGYKPQYYEKFPRSIVERNLAKRLRKKYGLPANIENIRKMASENSPKPVISLTKPIPYKKYQTPFTKEIANIEKTIERQLKKYQQLKEQEEAFIEEQQNIESINEEYNEAYGNLDEQETTNTTRTLGFMSVAEKRMQKIQSRPFDTEIDLTGLNENDRVELGHRIKDFYENRIKDNEFAICHTR